MRKFIHKKTIIFVGTTIVASLFGVLFIASWHQSDAMASTAGFNPGRIIDDSVFTNQHSMSASQIQSFLNSKVPSCDTNGTQPASDFGRPDLTHAQYASMSGWQAPPYTCLRNYSQNGKSAAQIIYNVAQQYAINPQVLIVLLQKEQGLVTDTWPLNSQYKTATGYGCPDNAACDSTYYGFTNQVTWAAKMYRAILNRSSTWYSPYVLGNNYILWNPNTSCGGSTVNIQNLATVALYDYTPYRPNQAALNAGYGTGDSCSSYGNRNFYLYFTDWFGPTHGSNYQWAVDSQGIYSDSSYTSRINDSDNTVYLQPGGSAYVKVIAKNIGAASWGSTIRLGTTNPRDRSSPFNNDSWLTPNRPTSHTETSVAYGQTGTFAFKVIAPQKAQRYREYYSLVDDGVAWFNDPGLYFDIVVTPSQPAPTGITYDSLAASTTMTSNQQRFSPERHSILAFEQNGNVALYTNFKKVWQTNTANTGANRLVNQSDGNLVLYNNDRAVWASNTSASGTHLMVQRDGNLVLYSGNGDVVWSSGTIQPDETNRVEDRAHSGSVIWRGQSMQSPDRGYNLTLQTDGNLVLTNKAGKVIYAVGVKSTVAYISMQTDGNLVEYDNNNHPLWSSKTSGYGSSYLAMQTDGNLVIYNASGHPLWATNTVGR